MILTSSLPTCCGFRSIHLNHATSRDREVELEHERIAPRSSLLALGYSHGAFLTVPYEPYACGRLGERASDSSAATETIRRGEAPPFIQQDEALVRCRVIEERRLGLDPAERPPAGVIAARQAAADNPRSSTVERRRANAAASGSCSPSMIRAWSRRSQANSESWSEAPASPTVAARRSISLWCGFSSRMRLDIVSSWRCCFKSRSKCMSMSPSSAMRQTALSVRRSELRTSLTASPSASLKIAIRLASLAGGSDFSSLRSSGSVILSRSTPPRVADLNGLSL